MISQPGIFNLTRCSMKASEKASLPRWNWGDRPAWWWERTYYSSSRVDVVFGKVTENIHYFVTKGLEIEFQVVALIVARILSLLWIGTRDLVNYWLAALARLRCHNAPTGWKVIAVAHIGFCYLLYFVTVLPIPNALSFGNLIWFCDSLDFETIWSLFHGSHEIV